MHEKEALALTWAATKLNIYLQGLHFQFQTDHKPLVEILSTKDLLVDELSPRLQRFRMNILRYSYNVNYIPGKDLIIADALSRGPRDKLCEVN